MFEKKLNKTDPFIKGLLNILVETRRIQKNSLIDISSPPMDYGKHFQSVLA